MHALRLLLRSLAAHRRAATAIEYACIAALLAMTIAVATTSVGHQVGGLLNNVARHLLGAPLVEPPAP